MQVYAISVQLLVLLAVILYQEVKESTRIFLLIKAGKWCAEGLASSSAAGLVCLTQDCEGLIHLQSYCMCSLDARFQDMKRLNVQNVGHHMERGVTSCPGIRK